jgi:hypothetical protein
MHSWTVKKKFVLAGVLNNFHFISLMNRAYNFVLPAVCSGKLYYMKSINEVLFFGYIKVWVKR